MSKMSKEREAEVEAWAKKIDAEAAAHGKTTRIYLSEKSNDLRLIFIRWLRADLEVLENIKSER